MSTVIQIAGGIVIYFALTFFVACVCGFNRLPSGPDEE